MNGYYVNDLCNLPYTITQLPCNSYGAGLLLLNYQYMFHKSSLEIKIYNTINYLKMTPSNESRLEQAVGEVAYFP